MERERSKFTFPCVTFEQMLAFDTNKPETWTQSPLVNAFLDAMERVRPSTLTAISRYIGLERNQIKFGLRTMTGMNYLEFMERWRKDRFYRLLAADPGIAPKEMASHLLFSSRGSLWTFLTRNKMIEPLSRHWCYGNHVSLRREAEELFEVDDTREQEVRAEVRRRKWEELTRTKKNKQ